MSLQENQVCLIDAGIKNLKDLKLPSTVIHLNVHCNRIQQINGIDDLKYLKYLDLSSNDIKQIAGLSQCSCLQTLNLSCNQIIKFEGLENLRLLKYLNISYNYIEDISGLKSFTGTTHHLYQLDLYGNKLASVKHITQSLIRCSSLRTLYIQKGNDTNPVCSLPAYHPNLRSQLPWLENLDGFDKHGAPASSDTGYIDIPGLDDHLEFLLSTSTELTSETSTSDIGFKVITPRLDSALQKFKQRNTHLTEEMLKQQCEVPKIEGEVIETKHNGHVTERLESLENKILNLVDLYQKKQINDNQKIRPQEVEEFLSSSDNSNSDASTSCKIQATKASTVHAYKQHKKPCVSSRPKKVQGTRISQATKNMNDPNKEIIPTKAFTMRSAEGDETYLSLMNEIDGERERRWKAEQATKHLISTTERLQLDSLEAQKIKEAAISSSAKFKHAFEEECTHRMKFEQLASMHQKELVALRDQLQQYKQAEEEYQKVINEHRKERMKFENEKLQHKGLLKELQFGAGGLKRELELSEVTIAKQKEKIQQIQELLIAREQEHQTTLQNMVHIDSVEVNKLIENRITKHDARSSEIIKQHEKCLNDRNVEYAELEDEFRMALKIESSRYKELQKKLEKTQAEVNELKISFEELAQKEARAKSLITELNMLVKEQKARITDIAKEKQDVQLKYKDGFRHMEQELLELRKNATKVECLQQDKDRLAAHIRGQESVLHGMRVEKKMWSRELAEQGSSLAQERGRLDLQLESQKNEIISLKNILNEQDDAMKIKCKLYDDQTDTIKKLKSDLLCLNEETKILSHQEKHDRESLKQEHDKAKQQACDLQEKNEALAEYNEELKSDLRLSNEELQDLKYKNENLCAQWDQRKNVIDQLESKAWRVKKTFEDKESKLGKERDELSKKLGSAREQFKTLEEKMELLLATKEHDFELKLRKLEATKENEIRRAKEQVHQVEEEMRLVLKENVSQKQTLDTHIQQLSKTLKAIQSDSSGVFTDKF